MIGRSIGSHFRNSIVLYLYVSLLLLFGTTIRDSIFTNKWRNEIKAKLLS